MKRFLGLLLTGMLLLSICCSCEPATPKRVVMQGYPYTISEGNDMTVMDAFVEGNSIVLKLSVSFTSATLKDLKGIMIHKSEVEQPDIFCNLEKTVARNGCDIFAQETTGKQEFFLVFTDSSITEETEISHYILSVPVGYDKDGNAACNDAIVLG